MIEEYLTQTRYRLPAPLQLYLQEKQPPIAFREAHARYYLTLAQEQDRKLEGSEQSEALSEIAIELGNFRAVFRFAQENAKWLLFGQLAVALSEFFYVRGLWNEGLGWLKQAETELNQQIEERQELKDASETDEMSFHLTRADLQVALAKFYNERQECETARQLCEDALQIFRKLGQQLGIVKALNCLGIIARYQEKLKEADRQFTEALEIAKVLGNKWHIAFTLNNLGLTAYHRRHLEEARLRYTESLHLARELGDKRSIAYTLNNLGKTVHQQGLREEAKHYYTESLRLTRELSTSSTGIPYLLDSFGKEALRHAKYEEARHYYTESLEYRNENSSPREIAESLYRFGQLARAEGKFEQSLCLFLRVASIYAETASTTPLYVDAVNKDIAALAVELGGERVEKLKLEMETLTLQEIVNICLSE
ncbi:tetratricopeptide repeat protein, partial [Candidatus Poribacteria bacterium]|nr:tetratricopeptide repeat protein [Candidatus Poribacteria bacterium]